MFKIFNIHLLNVCESVLPSVLCAMLSRLSHVQLLATVCTVAYQSFLFM